MFQDLKDLLVFLIPHFIEEYVAFEYGTDKTLLLDAFPVGPVNMFKSSAHYPLMARRKSILWLGVCFFNTFGELEPYNHQKGCQPCGR